MTRRVTFDGTPHWADLRELDEFHGGHQEEYWDESEKRAAQSPDGELSNKQGREVRDYILGLLIEGWSLDSGLLPFTTAARQSGKVPLPILNRLYREARPLTEALMGVTPEDPKTGTGENSTSPGSSAASADAPPEEQDGGTSAGPS